MQHFDNTLVGSINIPTNAETVVCSFQASPQQGSLATNPTAGNPVPTKIVGVINMTPGTGTTQIFIKVRQGIGITGNQIQGGGDSIQSGFVVGSSFTVPFSKNDNTGANSYSVTVQQIGASANGTINSINVDADFGLAGLA